jgi:branched-chain amino acid transport system permease protein
MSAAQWRRAMNSAAATAGQSAVVRPATVPVPGQRASGPSALMEWLRTPIYARHVLVLLALALYPAVASPFFTFQIGAQALVLGIIALSLTFLAGYGGMVSLAQMTVAGVAGYMVAIFGQSTATVSLGWPWWLAVVLAVVIATVFAAFVGWLSVRTEGIYTIMITLAIGVAFHYLALQNYSVFNGHQGFHEVMPPVVFGVQWRNPVPFYFLSAFWALAAYCFIKYLLRAPFGMALQGVRDNARRMNALGYHVNAHRIAAYTVAGFIAAIGGVLLVWYNGLIAPGSVNTGAVINILIISVLGGLRHPIGAFIGAIVFVLLQNFAIDLVDRERFNLVIGLVFLLIVLFSPDGLLGWWARLSARLRNGGAQSQMKGQSLTTRR